MDDTLKVVVVTHEGSVIDSSCTSLKFFSVLGYRYNTRNITSFLMLIFQCDFEMDELFLNFLHKEDYFC